MSDTLASSANAAVVDEVASQIPTYLLNQLLMLRGTLERRGRVSIRRDHMSPSYRLRVRAYTHEGFSRRVAIPVPDEAVRAVNKLLSHWRAVYRAQYRARQSAKAAAKQAVIEAEKAQKRKERLEAKEERAALRLMIGGTEWRQRKLLREWDSVNSLGLIQSTLWLASKQYARQDPPRRRTDKAAEAQKLGLFQTLEVQKVVREKVAERRGRIRLTAVT